jgi:hypothetical protein
LGAVTSSVDPPPSRWSGRQPNGVFEGTLAIRGATFSVGFTRADSYGFYEQAALRLHDPVSSSP